MITISLTHMSDPNDDRIASKEFHFRWLEALSKGVIDIQASIS